MKFILILVVSILGNDGMDVEIQRLSTFSTIARCQLAANNLTMFIPRKNGYVGKIGNKYEAFCVPMQGLTP